MWQKVLLANLILTLTSGALAQATTTEFIDVGFNCNVRVISETPKSVEPIADVLFLHGFSDRADNHGPLFKQIAAAGFRVISFDYPSHGETRCWNLDLHDFTSLSDLAVRVLAHAKFQSKRPLFLTGWSTGGLLAYRLAQREYFNDRHLAGLVLLAPGFSVYKIPGVFGWVTQASLLSNPYPPHMGPIKPQSPLAFLGFSSAFI